MSGQVTPEPTPRLVIPYGDRPIVTPTGQPTYEMYQWMQRINRGVATNITNIDNTITQLNTDTTNITNINADLTEVNEELQDQETQIQQLFGWVQVFLNSQPGPPGPPAPPPPASQANAQPPPPPVPPAFLALLAAIAPPAPPVRPAQSNITLRSAIASGSAVALTTGTPADVTSLALPAGTWQLTASVYFKAAATTTITSVAGSFSTTTATMGTDPGSFGNQYLAGVAGATIGQDVAVTGMTDVVTVGPTTYFLVADATFGVSTLSAYGLLVAIPIAQ